MVRTLNQLVWLKDGNVEQATTWVRDGTSLCLQSMGLQACIVNAMSVFGVQQW